MAEAAQDNSAGVGPGSATPITWLYGRREMTPEPQRSSGIDLRVQRPEKGQPGGGRV